MTLVGTVKGKPLKAYRGTITVQAQQGIDDVHDDQFDALFIPGGYSPDHLRGHAPVVKFTRAFFDKPRPVFSIGHAPQLLMTAGVVKGRRLTAWPTVRDDLEHFDAQVEDREVVVDGNLISARTPDDLPAFLRESLKKLS